MRRIPGTSPSSPAMRLNCSRDLKLKTVEFSPEQYLALKSELKSLEYDARKAPLMSVSEGRYCAMGGGAPLSRDGEVVAGVGLSGGTVEQDVAILEAALRES